MHRILIVEDNDMIRDALGWIVREAAGPDVSIIYAASVEQARAVLRTGRFDLVTLDLNLPDSIELQTVDALEAAIDEAGAQLLVLTAVPDQEVHGELAAREIPAFSKPFHLRPTVETIRAMLARPLRERRTIGEAKAALHTAITDFSKWLQNGGGAVHHA